jgi:hypothetical protein
MPIVYLFLVHRSVTEQWKFTTCVEGEETIACSILVVATAPDEGIAVPADRCVAIAHVWHWTLPPDAVFGRRYWQHHPPQSVYKHQEQTVEKSRITCSRTVSNSWPVFLKCTGYALRHKIQMH